MRADRAIAAEAVTESEEATGRPAAVDVAVLLLLVLVVYVPNQLHFPTELGAKGLNVLNILLALTAGALLLGRSASLRLPPLTGLVLFFWASMVAAFWVGSGRGDVSSLDLATTLKTIIAYMLLYFFFFLGADNHRRARLLVAALLFVAAVASLEAAREGIDYGFDRYVTSRRAAGPFGEDYRGANRAAVFFAIFIPTFLALALFYRSRPWLRVVATGAFLLGAFAIFVTFSRQGYYCLVAAVMLLLLRKSFLLALVAAVALSLYSWWLPDSAVERVGMTKKTDVWGDETVDVSVEQRHLIWEGGRAMVSSNPFGVGLGRFAREIGNYSPVQGMDAHSQYLLIAAEAGIQGLASYVLLLLGLLTIAFRLVRRAQSEEEMVLAWGYSTALLGVVLGGIYGSPVFMGEVTGNFWALSGIAARYLQLEDEHPSEEDDPD